MSNSEHLSKKKKKPSTIMYCTTGNANDRDEEFILKKKRSMTMPSKKSSPTNSFDKRQRKYWQKEGIEI